MSTTDLKNSKLFYYWLLTSFIMIFIMIMIGGLTRLTNSGLSITEWELFKGILPPLNNSQWDAYFLMYKKIPQYEFMFPDMTLSEFKVIFYWEYIHRFLGRLIGLFFLIPLIYFCFFSKINKRYISISIIVLLLIILQGIVGWYMVKSGLVNNVTVSHYRLSLHLVCAILIISIIFWMLLNFKKNTYISFFKKRKKNNLFYFFFLYFCKLLLLFVSGLDAGRIYQTWPLMNYSYFPSDSSISNLKIFFDLDNHGLVQFYHRNIAYLIVAYISYLGFKIFKHNLENLKKPFYLVSVFIFLQIFLGIITLISGLNIYLASAHQIGSLLLILSVLNLYYNYIK